MKTALGIILVIVIALGVWLSLRLGNTAPPATTPPADTTATTTADASLSNSYGNGQWGFAIRYPKGYTVDEGYVYQALGPSQEIRGVKFTIDPAIAKGTNLSSDTYLSVEVLPAAKVCDAGQFLDLGTQTTSHNLAGEDGTIYSFASTTDAAAGNRYEESVYALKGPHGCIAVRYYIHYGVLENYPAGQVVAFDKAALLAQFDAMRKTLSLVQ